MKKDLKAFYRYDGNGRLIPGSLILSRKSPKVGKWDEIPAYQCGGFHVYVCGAGTEAVNGMYTYAGKINNKPYYTKGIYKISWGEWPSSDPNYQDWEITDGTNWFYWSLEDVATPNLVTGWITDDGTEPAPIVTLCPCSVLNTTTTTTTAFACEDPDCETVLQVGSVEETYGYITDQIGTLDPNCADVRVLVWAGEVLTLHTTTCYTELIIEIDGSAYTMSYMGFEGELYYWNYDLAANPFTGRYANIKICGLECTTTTTTTVAPTTTTTTTAAAFPQDICVSGCEEPEFNGTYTYLEMSEGKPHYIKEIEDGSDINMYWQTDRWTIVGVAYSLDDVDDPSLVTTWVAFPHSPVVISGSCP